MDELLLQLKAYGADMEGAMGRFLDDVALYKTCFAAFLEDDAFQNLGKALLAMEYEEAFECAHTLKGVAGNMGLTPLYEVICRIVEALRHQEYANLLSYHAEMIDQLNRLKRMQK